MMKKIAVCVGFGVALLITVNSAEGQSGIISGGSTEVVTNASRVYVDDLVIGRVDGNNQLIVSNNASVSSRSGILGREDTADNNYVLIGAGSSWTNADDLFVGERGDHNLLEIRDGGVVVSEQGRIGRTDDALNNQVTVSGSNSLWNNTGDLEIGYYQNSGNNLTIDDGGRVIVGDKLELFDNNTLNVNRDGTLQINGAFLVNSGFSFNDGATLEVEGNLREFYQDLGTDQTLVFRGPDALWNYRDLTQNSRRYVIQSYWVGADVNGGNNALIITNGAQVENINVILGKAEGSDSNRVVVTGAGSSWDVQTNLFVGQSGSYNSLLVEDGASMGAVTGVVGFASNASYNAILVQGDGTTAAFNDLLIVGGHGSSNRLDIINGAALSAGDVSLGSSNMFAGVESVGNMMVISNGATVSMNSLGVGSVAGTHDNQLLITGQNTTNGISLGDLGIGWDSATNNSVIISNGAWASVNDLVISNAVDGNRIELRKDAWLSVNSDMDGGMTSNSNGFFWSESTLEILGVVSNFYGVEGGTNTLVVGAGGEWLDHEVSVGINVATNRMIIRNGGSVSNGVGFVGRGIGASNNVVEVESGGIWTNVSSLVVGEFGAHNTLNIHNGGLVAGGDLTVGQHSDENRVLVDGSDAWVSEVMVGENGSKNQILVSNGGEVISDSVFLGDGIGSESNVLRVSGAGSRWITGDYYKPFHDFVVGYEGSFNQLLITNGGEVRNDDGLIGYEISATGNSVDVNGAGSVWQVGEHLVVGEYGSSNRMSVTDGGLVASDMGFIGHNTGADFNRVEISGAESVWTNTSELLVGERGSNNSLQIMAGANVISGDSKIGAEPFASHNEVLVSGEDSAWTIQGSLTIGHANNTSNTLTIQDGGSVSIAGDFATEGVGNTVQLLQAGSLSLLGNVDLSGGGFVGGAGSTLDVYGALTGLSVLDGMSLRLLGDRAGWTETGDIMLLNGAYLYIDSGVSVAASNYLQSADSVLVFGAKSEAAGNPVVGNLVVTDTVDIASNAAFRVERTADEFDNDELYTNQLVSATTLLFDGVAPTNDSLAHLNTSGPMMNVSYFTTNNAIYAVIGIGKFAGTTPTTNTSVASLSDLERLKIEHRGMKPNFTLFENMTDQDRIEHFFQGTPNYLHAEGMMSGMDRVFARTTSKLLRTIRNMPPKGVNGPSSAESRWEGWFQGYGSTSSRDEESGFSGYGLDLYGTVFGLDNTQQDIMYGLAGGFATSEIDQDNGYASSADTGYGVVYSTLRNEDTMLDLLMAYGQSSVETRSDNADRTHAEFDAGHWMMKAGVRTELDYKRFVLIPEMSAFAGRYSQDGYVEDSLLVGRKIDDYDRWSYKSFLGATYAINRPLRRFDLITRVRAGWEHEFNTDPGAIGFALDGGINRYSFDMPAPVEDLFRVGVSFGVFLNERTELTLGADGQMADGYSALNYSGNLRFSF